MVAKKQCRYRFRSPLHFTAVSNLNCSLVFSSSLSFIYFRRAKVAKRPAPAKSVITAFCSRVASDIPRPAVICRKQLFVSSIGDKTTRFSRNNSITYMHRSNKFCPVSAACPAVRCDFDGAGFKILPLYAL